ncbi:MAG: alginate export family protein [Nitrospirota bacterium]
MSSIRKWKGWVFHPIALAAALVVAGFQLLASPVLAGYQLPPGERITNLPHIPRSMPQKESYEIYDPVIGRNFDVKNLWLRADLRVRPEFRNGVCFGGGAPAGGACNTASVQRANSGKGANDFYVQQWVRLGIGYDLSPDVNFYFEIIDSATWGANGNPNNAGNGGDPLNHNCGVSATGGQSNCRLGVRAAYVLIRNLGDIQGLSMKAGRQYVIFGNHSLFGHFDWANTGYSHDGIMFQYSTKNFDSYLGWFRNAETDIYQGAPVGSLAANVNCTTGGAVGSGTAAGTACGAAARAGTTDGSADADMFIFYNQIKSVPGMLIEPYYVLYMNNMNTFNNNAQGVGTPKHANQIRSMIGNRLEIRKGNWDFINETAWQTGSMSSGSVAANPQARDLTINAWATRNWLGYTFYESKWKPRIAVGFDYASGDGNANCAGAGGTSPTAGRQCKTANTFENFFPTNHIHMGYMDIIAWRNMWSPQFNYQMRPTERDHFEFWYSHLRLASARDNWYRGAQGIYVWSANNNDATHIGDETDFTWTRMFADGKVAFQATYGHLFTGSYIAKNLGTHSDQSWGFVQLWMNF